MNVEIRCYGTVRRTVGQKELSLDVSEGTTVADVLDVLGAEYEPFDSNDLVVMVNGSHVSDRGTQLAAGDTLGLGTVISE